VLVGLVVEALAVSEVVCEVETAGVVIDVVRVTELVELLGVTELVALLALLTTVVPPLDLDGVVDSVTVMEDDVVVL